MFIITGGGALPARAGNEIGPDMTGGWDLSREEIKGLLDTEGRAYKELNTARDERLKVNSSTLGEIDSTYIFENGMLVRVQGHKRGYAETERGFLEQLAIWEQNLTAGWNEMESLGKELDIADNMLDVRQVVYTDGWRYVAITAGWDLNLVVVIDVLYFNPEHDAGQSLWRHCLESGDFLKREAYKAIE